MNLHENFAANVDSLNAVPAFTLKTAKQWTATHAHRHPQPALEFSTFIKAEKTLHSEFDAEYGWFFPDARDAAEAGQN